MNKEFVVIKMSSIENSLFEFPEMMRKAMKEKLEFEFSEAPRNIVIAGMGGSAIPGDLLLDLLKLKRLRKMSLEVCRDYNLPEYVNKESLVIVISYSGNTEESLSCFEQAIEKGARVLCITSNGTLETLCEKNKIPLIRIEKNLKPRAALPFLFISLLKIFEKIANLSYISNELEESVEILERIREKYFTKNKEMKNRGDLYNIAKCIHKCDAVIIYSPESLRGVATRIKTQINENSKMHSWTSTIPELNHNELSGWQEVKKSDFAVIFIRDVREDKKIKARIEYTKRIVKNKAIVKEIKAIGNSELARLFSLIYQGDLLSLVLAKIRKVNANEVPLQDKIKEILKRIN